MTENYIDIKNVETEGSINSFLLDNCKISDNDINIINFIKNVPRDKKKTLIGPMKKIGTGAAGKVYVSNLKEYPEYPIVIKQLKNNKHSTNEYEALKFLQHKMINKEFPIYFVLTYGCYSKDNNKYIILEKVDASLEDIMVDNNMPKEWFFKVYAQIATAVSYLEKEHFNHGDLWNDNVMIKWLENSEDISKRAFHIKLIDYDSAFKENSEIKNPSLGGGLEYRNSFILGYDLNRYFDAMLYSHNSYISKKNKFLQKESRRNRMSVEEFSKLPATIEELKEFEDENIIFPEEVLQFFNELNPVDVEIVSKKTNLVRFSGANILRKLNLN